MTSDDIGERGEAIFRILITGLFQDNRPIFRPRFLGEKAQTLDFLVELINEQAVAGYFFAQIKATLLGFTQRGQNRRLRLRIETSNVKRLLSFPAPTYLVGIDARLDHGEAFIVSINDVRPRSLKSLTTRYPLTPGNMEILWKEVRDYWVNRDMILRGSYFEDRG